MAFIKFDTTVAAKGGNGWFKAAGISVNDSLSLEHEAAPGAPVVVLQVQNSRGLQGASYIEIPMANAQALANAINALVHQS